MNDPQPIEKFLETASAGLAGDRELQLDVQMELRSHLDERLRDAEEAGLKGPEAEAKALAMMGEPLELADKIATANRPRMRLRAWLRHTLRWALVPVAVLVAVACAWPTMKGGFLVFQVMRYQSFNHPYGFDTHGDPWNNPSLFFPPIPAKATPEQRQAIDSMANRRFIIVKRNFNAQVPPYVSEKPEALWRQWPDNKLYLHNYVTALFLDTLLNLNGEQRQARRNRLQALLPQLQAHDPGNARFDYMMANLLAGQQTFYADSVPVPQGPEEDRLVIKDRQALDTAMGHLKAALASPELRLHYGEMERDYLKLLDPSTSQFEWYQKDNVFKCMTPDFTMVRWASFFAPLYGELLAREGRREKAEVFLNSWERIAHHLLDNNANDSWGLYIAAISIPGAAEDCAGVYERLGETAKAARIREAAKQLSDSYKNYRLHRKDNEKTVSEWLPRCGSEMAGVCASYIGEPGFPEKEIMECGRQQEYLQTDAIAVGLVSALALLGMVGCLTVALWFQYRRKSESLLLLPSLTEVVTVVAGGVLLPFLAYHALVRLLPHSGREFSLFYAWPKCLAFLIFLVVAIGWLTLALSSHFLNRRCRQLGVPTPPRGHWGWLAGAGMMLAAQLAFGCLPEFGTVANESPSFWPLLPAAGLLLLVLGKISFAIPPPAGRLWHWLVFSTEAIGWAFVWIQFERIFFINGTAYDWSWYVQDPMAWLAVGLVLLFLLWPFFYWRHRCEQRNPPRRGHWGSLARSLIPVLALSMLVINLMSAPWYRLQERRLVEQKLAWFSLGNDQPGWGNQKDEKLRAELQAALEKLKDSR